jgi:hypothetical protein
VLVNKWNDGSQDGVPMLIQRYRHDWLNLQHVAKSVLLRAAAEIKVVLEGHDNKIGQRVAELLANSAELLPGASTMLGGAEMDGAAANREVAAIRTSAAKRTNAMKMEFFMMSFLDVLASKKRTPGKKVFVVVSLFGFAGELPKQNLGSECAATVGTALLSGSAPRRVR